MKKKYWWICVLFSLTVIAILCTTTNENDIINHISSNNVGKNNPVSTPDALGGPMGTKGVWLQNVSGETILADGDLTDWGSTLHDVFNDVDVYFGYDSSDVYVGLAWVDTSRDGKLSEWNKTGSATLDNATHGTYDQLDGADDMVAVGFTNSSGYSDIWIWMESIRGDDAYAYEVNGNWAPDGGVLPYDENYDTTTIAGWEQPDRLNNTNPILDHDGLVNGTAFTGWFDIATPTLSQSDVAMGYTWNATGDDRYIVEFIRPLDTGAYVDDILLDLGNAIELGLMKFWVGSENKQDCIDFSVSTKKYNMEPPSETNDAAEFEWDIISNPVTEALLLQGAVYDDFVVEHNNFEVYLSGWADTYGAGWNTIADDINSFTGEWSYLFYYDEDDMPLGDNTVNITWTPKYDVVSYNITAWQWANISDVDAPQINGIVDIGSRYQDRTVPYEEENLTITASLKDDYSSKDNLSIVLYLFKDGEYATSGYMLQFFSGGSTFNINITVEHNSSNMYYNYSYFIDAWDENYNKRTSATYWFLTEPQNPEGAIAPLGERTKEFLDEYKWIFTGGGVSAIVIGILPISVTAIVGAVKSTVISSCTKAITQQTLSGVIKIEPVTRILKTISKLTNGRVIRIISNRMFNILEKQLVLNTNQSRNISDILLNFVIKKVPHFKPRQFTRLKKLVDLPLNNYHSFILGGILASNLAFSESISAFEKAKIDADNDTKSLVDSRMEQIKLEAGIEKQALELPSIEAFKEKLKKALENADKSQIPQVTLVDSEKLNEDLNEKIQTLSIAEQEKTQLIEKYKIPKPMPVDISDLEYLLHLCRNRKLFFQLIQSLLLLDEKNDGIAKGHRSEMRHLDNLQLQFNELAISYNLLSKDPLFKDSIYDPFGFEEKMLEAQSEQCYALGKFIQRIKTKNVNKESNYRKNLNSARRKMYEIFLKKDKIKAKFYAQRYIETQKYIELYLDNPEIKYAPIVRSFSLIPFSEGKFAQKFIYATGFIRSFDELDDEHLDELFFEQLTPYNFQAHMNINEFPDYFPKLKLELIKLVDGEISNEHYNNDKKEKYFTITTEKSSFVKTNKMNAKVTTKGNIRFGNREPSYPLLKFVLKGSFYCLKTDFDDPELLKKIPLNHPRPLRISGMNEINVRVVDEYGPHNHILVFSAQPLNVTKKRTDVEFRDITSTLLAADHTDNFTLHSHPALLPEEFTRHFRNYFSVIAHFSGLSNEEGAFTIEDRDKKEFTIDDEALAQILGSLSDNIKCVVLNGCYRDDLAQKIAKYVNCVVGTPLDCKDDYRVIFATEFYNAIGNGRKVGKAIKLAKNQIGLKKLDPELIKFEFKNIGQSENYSFILHRVVAEE